MASQTLQEARRLCDQGKYTEAARVLEAALDTDGNNIDLIVELGETLFTLGYYKRAAQVLGDGLDHSDELNNSTVAAGNDILRFTGLLHLQIQRLTSPCGENS